MTTGLEALRDLILDDPAGMESLDAGDAELFVAKAAALAWARGLGVEAAEIGAALQRASLPPTERATAPPGWLPVEVSSSSGHPVVTWLHFGRRRLVEPFYADSAMRAGFTPLNRLVRLRTPLPEGDGRAPDGLILHMSRCGSTLAAQMLAASPANRVIAEASAMDAVLALDLDDDAKVRALRAMAAVLGRARDGETRTFFKLDCWHTRDLPLLRRAFPHTPWVFLYREPIEVLISHERRWGVQMIPELTPPARLGLDDPGLPTDDYRARVLAAVCEAAVRHHDEAGLLVNYRDMPGALWERILPHFGVQPSAEELALMRGAASRDAKAPDQAFKPDGATKRREAGERLKALCERHMGAAYRRLEALRATQA